jgi:transketolase
LLKKPNYVYLIVGDGELNEGQCWEAFQFIAHHKLNRCIVCVDDNKKQLDGKNVDIVNPFDLEAKFKAFGFTAWTVKGNDEGAIFDAITRAKKVEDSAVCLVLDTIKGQGVPFFETLADNHSVKFDNSAVNQAADEAIAALESYIKGAA